jgi:hypothetical protein
MRNKTLLTALTAAAFLSGAMLSNQAKAMTFATPFTVGVVTTDTGLVQKAHYWGYYHRPYYHHWGYGYGYHRPYYGLYGYRPYGYYRPWGWRRW